MMGAVAEFKRNIIRWRQVEGIDGAKVLVVQKGHEKTLDRKNTISIKATGDLTDTYCNQFALEKLSLFFYHFQKRDFAIGVKLITAGRSSVTAQSRCVDSYRLTESRYWITIRRTMKRCHR